MNISMYYASIPHFIRMLGNLKAILEKAAAHVEAKKIDPAALITFRFYPDMFAFARQVQSTSDIAKGCAARLSGTESPKYEDNESSFPELIARMDKTIAYLKTFKPEQIDGSEEREVTLNSPRGPLKFNGQQYLLHFALPNFDFHVTTAYNILRHNGVEIGKFDYLGAGRG
ncbi:MAG: DUF1993 domain-containing protein [Nevskiales bacterium]